MKKRFNLGLFVRGKGGNHKLADVTVNLGSTKGRGSSTRMFNYCNQTSANPSGCINQFINVAISAPIITNIVAGDSQLTVNFTAPSNGGYSIINYQYSTNNGASFTSAGTIISPIVISGLTNGTTYQVLIRAESINNFSPNSNVISVTPPTLNTTILVYNAYQGENFNWGGVTFDYDSTFLPKYSYKAITNSIPASIVNFPTTLIGVTIGTVVTSIGQNAFRGCSNLTNVTFTTTSIVTSIGESAFRDCTALTPINIPNSVISIGVSAFQGCSSLISINVDGSNANYSSVDGVLFDKLQTTIIQYPGGKSGSYTIPTSTVASIGQSAFQSCTALTIVTIPNSVTSIITDAFRACTALTNVIFTPTSTVASIGQNAFRGCSSLTSITIPNSVTSIGSNAFFNSGLTTVTISSATASVLGISGSPISFFGKTNVDMNYI
jgi:hypothetical protein